MALPDLKYYILDAEHHPVEADLLTWGRWFEDIGNRIVGYTQINSQVEVSTVFIGIDHRFFGGGPPLVFETMVFGSPLDGYTRRYSSYDDAAAGHAAAVRKVREAIGQKVS